VTRADSSRSSAPWRLLGGWRDIQDDIRRLGLALARVPDTCGCPDGDAHLRGICQCCERERSAAAPCDSCVEILQALSERFERLGEDRLRFVPAVDEQLQTLSPDEGPARLARASRQIAVVIRTFHSLQSATDEFRGLQHRAPACDCGPESRAALEDRDPGAGRPIARHGRRAVTQAVPQRGRRHEEIEIRRRVLSSRRIASPNSV
jgi:hypothetical protein